MVSRYAQTITHNGAGAGTRTGVAAGTEAGTEERVAEAVTLTNKPGIFTHLM